METVEPRRWLHASSFQSSAAVRLSFSSHHSALTRKRPQCRWVHPNQIPALNVANIFLATMTRWNGKEVSLEPRCFHFTSVCTAYRCTAMWSCTTECKLLHGGHVIRCCGSLNVEKVVLQTETRGCYHLQLLRKWRNLSLYFLFFLFALCTQIDGNRLFKDVKAYHTAVKGKVFFEMSHRLTMPYSQNAILCPVGGVKKRKWIFSILRSFLRSFETFAILSVSFMNT